MQLRIKASARFPLEGVDWQRKLLLGGATGLLLELIFVGLAYLTSEEAAFGIAPLVVGVNFPALGYILEVYRGTLLWEVGALPEWENWPGLLKSGLATFVVALAYGVVPLLLLLLGLGLLVRGGILLFLGMLLMALGLLAGLFMLFFLPMALARRPREGKSPAVAAFLNLLFLGLGYNYLDRWYGFLIFQLNLTAIVLASLVLGPLLPYAISYALAAPFAVQTWYLAKRMEEETPR